MAVEGQRGDKLKLRGFLDWVSKGRRRHVINYGICGMFF